MLKKIILRNFMSHTNSVMELSAGLNVLTGPNNSGKSAVISALQLLAELPVKEGDYMVRHGTQETEVTVETCEGDQLTWQRNRAAISLTINGERCIRLQNDRDHYLNKLHKKLKLPKVIGKDIKEPFDIHFGTQKDPIFLINKPGSHAASFFASSSDAGRLVEIRDRYKDLVKSKKLDRKNLQSSLENQKQMLTILEPIKEMENSVLLVKEMYKKFPQEEQAITQIAASVQEIKKRTHVHQKQLRRAQGLQMLKPLPKMDDAYSLAVHIEAMKKEIKRVEHESLKVKALASLLGLPSLLPCDALHADFSALKELSWFTTHLQRANAIFSKLEKLPEMKPVDRLREVLTTIKDVTHHIEKNKNVIAYIGLMQPQPIIEDVTSILACLKKLAICTKERQRAAKRFNDLHQLSEPPHYQNSVELNKQCSLLKSLMKIQAKNFRAVDALSALQPPPTIFNSTALEYSLKQLRSVKSHYQKLNHQTIHIGQLQPLPNLVSTEQLGLFLKDYPTLIQRLGNTAKKLQHAESALQDYLAKHPACPLCGGNFSKIQEACHA